METSVERCFLEGGNLQERYCFVNKTRFPIFFKRRDVGIYMTLNDNYEDTDVCLAKKCHAHISCGQGAFWAMALQMGGTDLNIGVNVTQGSIDSYSVERDLTQESNDRGNFILHPQIHPLMSGEKVQMIFEPFWFKDESQSIQKLLEMIGFPVVTARQFTSFWKEPIQFDVQATAIEPEHITVNCEDMDILIQCESCETGALLHCGCLPQKVGKIKVKICTPTDKPLSAFLFRHCWKR